MPEAIILKVHALEKHFGGLQALHRVDFQVRQGQIFGLIGPNGAGKTTLFNCITGVYVPTQGSILFGGHEIVGLRPFQIARRGISRTFQNIRIFASMTALENVMVGQHRQTSGGMFRLLRQDRRAVSEEQERRARALSILETVGLAGAAHELSVNLPYGHQRRLEIARALATGPRLVLLDEPAAGMNETEINGLIRVIREIRDRGMTFLLIEHHMRIMMRLSDQLMVLDHGVKIAEGRPGRIKKDPRVIDAYLGRN